jgi:hypothetical protein
MPIAAIIAGALEAIRLGADILEAHNKGMTQGEMNAKWVAMQSSLSKHNAEWDAASRGTQP